MLKTKSGFTLVELLIVIVVIAILAAITIVAYNGVQDRAHNTTVQSDLANYAKKAQLFRVEHGHYPESTSELAELTMKASIGSYSTNYYNLYYCTNVTTHNVFRFEGRSKSGTVFFVSSNDGSGSFVASHPTVNGICSAINTTGTDRFYTEAYNNNTGNWAAWAQ